jgi:hypothetical protein
MTEATSRNIGNIVNIDGDLWQIIRVEANPAVVTLGALNGDPTVHMGAVFAKLNIVAEDIFAYEGEDADPVDDGRTATPSETARIAHTIIEAVKADMIANGGPIPPNVRSFAELHDYVDANEYVIAALEAEGWDHNPASEGQAAAANRAMDMVNVWLSAKLAATRAPASPLRRSSRRAN